MSKKKFDYRQSTTGIIIVVMTFVIPFGMLQRHLKENFVYAIIFGFFSVYGGGEAAKWIMKLKKDWLRFLVAVLYFIILFIVCYILRDNYLAS